MTSIFFQLAGYSSETLNSHCYSEVITSKSLVNEKGERSITFPLSDKAQKVWDSLAQRLHYISITSRVAGGIILVAGLWKSFQSRSPLMMVGSLVVACTAEIFARRVNKAKVVVEKQAKLISGISESIRDFRKKVIKTEELNFGLVDHNLPKNLENIALSLFTDEEIKTLWTNHVNKNPGYNVSLEVFDQIPFGHPMRAAANACLQLIQEANGFSYDAHFPNYSSTMEETKKFFRGYKFAESKHEILFHQRFETNFSNLNLPVSLIDQALNQLVGGKMDQIATNPENIPNEINADKYTQILLELSVKQRLGSVFEGQSEDFCAWALKEFSQFPEETPYKQLYLSCIPIAQEQLV